MLSLPPDELGVELCRTGDLQKHAPASDCYPDVHRTGKAATPTQGLAWVVNGTDASMLYITEQQPQTLQLQVLVRQ